MNSRVFKQKFGYTPMEQQKIEPHSKKIKVAEKTIFAALALPLILILFFKINAQPSSPVRWRK
jgi:hypothetical protein